MSKVVDYFMMPMSPWTYLGHDRFVALAAKHGATVNVKPVDLARVFAVSGGVPLKQRAAQRQEYRLHELDRWSKFLGVPINATPKFSGTSVAAANRWIISAQSQGTPAALKLAGALARAYWAEERDISNEATLVAVATEQGLPAGELATAAASPESAARLEALTEEAIDRRVFGVPWYLCDGEPFWGQDRLDFLARKLAK
ncbi:MAG TPA: 2-hydroxychromene-2-carboxylate isomerase [Casimicrobiaceae bacterium]|nr:2-hydroxychromene-2-carboxylate isomerase [Casimicrobiaceae bacterium]